MDHGGWFVSKPRDVLLTLIERFCLRLAGGVRASKGWNVGYLGFYENHRTKYFKSWKLENEHSRNDCAALTLETLGPAGLAQDQITVFKCNFLP